MGNFLLIYDYMENGSLDKRVFECEESKMLNFEERLRILRNVASGILYLHEGWESKVLHRDIKASNVLLDKDMNGRLGDFGLARVHDDHHQVSCTTKVVGTLGYMAPEVIKTGRASTQTDVYMFGILILEVMCGRRPIEEGKASLVEWVWELMVKGQIVNAIDVRMREELGGIMNEEDVERVLNLGLLCAYPEPKARPKMRQVVKILEGRNNEEDGEYNESEDMRIYLLQRMKSSTDEWCDQYSHYFNFSSHPTFEDIINPHIHSSSISFTYTDSIIDGR
ncbi:L-type lectin-domain containing receptor kinase VII.1 [Senna tora]|uniref:non-specific serine/threonine protein kinase n=1 Tax=Senna tora TaxID=362788 RepID=A0A834X9N8_9FABA|nr:L-type lectin-domain containing receptor kinase VII.1 [Senna tora]